MPFTWHPHVHTAQECEILNFWLTPSDENNALRTPLPRKLLDESEML